MKTSVKTLTMALILGLLSINNISAQKPEGHRPPPIPDEEQIDKIVDDMDKALSLTEDQKKEIKVLYTDHFNEVKELMDKHRQEREEGKKEHDQLRNEFENQVKAILTDEQKKGFDEFQNSHKPKDAPHKR